MQYKQDAGNFNVHLTLSSWAATAGEISVYWQSSVDGLCVISLLSGTRISNAAIAAEPEKNPGATQAYLSA